LGYLAKVIVSVDPSAVTLQQSFVSVKKILVCIELLIIDRVEHGEDAAQFARPAQFDEVKLAPACLRKASFAKSKHIDGQVEPNISSDGRHWDSGV